MLYIHIFGVSLAKFYNCMKTPKACGSKDDELDRVIKGTATILAKLLLD